MDERTEVNEGYRMASPWPIFVALGLPIAELGLLLGFVSLSVGGLLLFGGSVAGMLWEAEYVATPWRALVAVALLAIGLGVGLVYADPLTPVSLLTRGYAAIGAGAAMLLAGLVGELFATEQRTRA